MRIGKVAKEKGVSIKALRYYDKIGILRPAYVDKVTNYRYYTPAQLYILDAISLCVELGIPLKEFDRYRTDDGQFDLQKLLYDGKAMGEQRILDIKKRLGTLSKTISAIEKGEVVYQETVTTAEADVKVKEKPSAPKKEYNFASKNIPPRGILTAELNGDGDSKKILRLNMLAQLLGMTASYPAGTLYDYDANGSCTRYAYILVEGYEECQDKRLRVLPGGEYKSLVSGRNNSKDELEKKISEEIHDLRGLTVVETDIINSNQTEIQFIK